LYLVCDTRICAHIYLSGKGRVIFQQDGEAGGSVLEIGVDPALLCFSSRKDTDLLVLWAGLASSDEEFSEWKMVAKNFTSIRRTSKKTCILFILPSSGCDSTS